MQQLIDWIVKYCIKNSFVEPDQVPWLQYGIEKRIMTMFGIILCFFVAAIAQGLIVAASFLTSFYLLRSRANGYHAKTLGQCFWISIVLELFFLLCLYPILTPIRAIIICTLCLSTLLLLAPYNHPSIHYSGSEIAALKLSIRKRISVLGAGIALSSVIRFNRLTFGLTTGIAMTAFMLCLAYILEWRNKHDSHPKSNQQSLQETCHQNG